MREFQYNKKDADLVLHHASDEDFSITHWHNMCDEHTEVLGQFLDQTGLSVNELIMFFNVGVHAFNQYGLWPFIHGQ